MMVLARRRRTPLTGSTRQLEQRQRNTCALMPSLHRLVPVLLAVFAVVLAGHGQSDPAESKVGTEGKPQYGAYGFDTEGMDRSIKPGDDFFGYANGNWVK